MRPEDIAKSFKNWRLDYTAAVKALTTPNHSNADRYAHTRDHNDLHHLDKHPSKTTKIPASKTQGGAGIQCKYCQSVNYHKHNYYKGNQRFKCQNCSRIFTLGTRMRRTNKNTKNTLM